MNQASQISSGGQEGGLRQGPRADLGTYGHSGKGHILLEDIPGVGKTTMALGVFPRTGLDYGRVQFTPDAAERYHGLQHF